MNPKVKMWGVSILWYQRNNTYWGWLNQGQGRGKLCMGRLAIQFEKIIFY